MRMPPNFHCPRAPRRRRRRPRSCSDRPVAATATGAPGAAVAPTTVRDRLHQDVRRPAHRQRAHLAGRPPRASAPRSRCRLDAASNTTVWRKNGDTAYKPASTNKLVTASNALTLWGPDTRFTTRVRTGSAANRVDPAGLGDPSLSSANLDALATHHGHRAARPKDHLRRGSTSTTTSSRHPPSPTGGRRATCPTRSPRCAPWCATSATTRTPAPRPARYFRDRLKAYGVTTAGYYGRANAATGLHGHREQQGRRPVDHRQPDAAQQRQRDRRGPAQDGRAQARATVPRGPAPAPPRPTSSVCRASRPPRSTTGRGSRAPTGSPRCSWPGSSTAVSTPATSAKLWPLQSARRCRPPAAPAPSPQPLHAPPRRSARSARCGPRPAR